jgi:exodeoxyribonuclease V alpha subunit
VSWWSRSCLVSFGAANGIPNDSPCHVGPRQHDAGSLLNLSRSDAVKAVKQALVCANKQHLVDVVYEYGDLDELVLAYACSIHKAQGSEYPCVVIPLHAQHYVLLQRNLLYTAVTRGRRMMIVVGSRRALAIAVKNAKTSARFTRLASRLQAGVR